MRMTVATMMKVSVGMLHTPVEAMRELESCRDQPDHPRPTASCARFIATPVVIAELRRIADVIEENGSTPFDEVAELLRDRAAVLDRRED